MFHKTDEIRHINFKSRVVKSAYNKKGETTMHNFKIIKSEDFRKGIYCLIIDGEIACYADSILMLAGLADRIIKAGFHEDMY